MNGEEFVAAVREARATELDRLGSEKALVAETDATLESEAVLRAVAGAEARAVETFETWAEDERHERAREVFADAAARERDHYDRTVTALDGDVEVSAEDPVQDHLRTLDGSVERVAAGMVGRPLVAARTLLQVVNFFINEGDTANTDRFREIREEIDDLVSEGATLLEDVCETDDDWQHARAAAEETIAVAYREYVDTLEEMGLDPKPVC